MPFHLHVTSFTFCASPMSVDRTPVRHVRFLYSCPDILVAVCPRVTVPGVLVHSIVFPVNSFGEFRTPEPQYAELL